MKNSPDHQITKSDFQGLRVAAFESRMADEMTRLIARYGGQPFVAPSMREIPLAHNTEVLKFGERLLAGKIDMLILLTGVGTRTMIEVLDTRFSREAILAALRGLTLVARGPKPVSALRGEGLTAEITVAEPNTWHEIVSALDARTTTLRGKHVAVQEYGVPNTELLAALKERGAEVESVPVYRWALPEDTGPMRQVLQKILAGDIAVLFITNAVQVEHILHILKGDGHEEPFRQALGRMLVASIGPTASERLKSYRLPVDLEPTHPKMGILVKETAQQAAAILQKKGVR